MYFGVLPDGNAEEDGGEDGRRITAPQHEKIKDLAVRGKLRLVMTMIWGYALPLATYMLMLLENTATQEILPGTPPPPTTPEHSIWPV